MLKHVSDVYLYVMMLRNQIPSNELRLLKTLLNRALFNLIQQSNNYYSDGVTTVHKCTDLPDDINHYGKCG